MRNIPKKKFVLANHYTLLYSMSGVFGILIAPLCGFILDYKAYLGREEISLGKSLDRNVLQVMGEKC